jgi:uncharacterized protein (DUF885 family)
VNRRQFIEASGAMIAVHPLAGHAAEHVQPDDGPDARVERLLADIAETLLNEYPSMASYFGLDKDKRADLKARLRDRSLAGLQRHAQAAARRLAMLKAIDTSDLGLGTRNDVGVVRAAHELALEGFAFPFGDVGTISLWPDPYVVAQNTGAFVETPDFLDSSHAIAGTLDAEAYLSRLEAYADQLDAETGRLSHAASIGVIAPTFLLDKTLRQMKAARAQPIAEWTVVASIARRTAKIRGDFARRAARIAAEKIAPALDRQIAELSRHRAHATDDAGVWKLPEGDAYYSWALRAATTSRLTPDEVHALGMEQVKALAGQMDGPLRAQGLTKGSVGERMTALGKDPRYLFPNTDAGRSQILDYVNGRVIDIRQRLPRAFSTLVPGKLMVKRVPPELELGAPSGYAVDGTIDGSVPGNYYINLHDNSIWPRYALPTLTYHEAIPGHIWQGEYTHQLPLIRLLLTFNAYSEGWGLYAEQLADELGVYEDDPVGRLGYLQSMSFRACRLVVDTGLHAKRWTRAQAIEWFATTNGSTLEEVSANVDRYCAWPGQACGYKVGHIEINRLRDKAAAALGPRYDLRLFNDAVMKAGNVPLTLLEQLIDAHITARG